MRGIVLALFCVVLSACAEAAQTLPVESIVIDTHRGPVKFTVEIAADPASQERGLMYRKSMAANAGMLFAFPGSATVSFWMKNTYIPLDMLFVRSNGTISTIEPNAVPLSLDSIRSAEPVRAVIELKGGRAHDLDIEPGDKVHAAVFQSAPAH